MLCLLSMARIKNLVSLFFVWLCKYWFFNSMKNHSKLFCSPSSHDHFLKISMYYQLSECPWHTLKWTPSNRNWYILGWKFRKLTIVWLRATSRSVLVQQPAVLLLIRVLGRLGYPKEPVKHLYFFKVMSPMNFEFWTFLDIFFLWC